MPNSAAVNSEQYIKHFTTRLRQLILTLKEYQLANDKLRSDLDAQKEEISQLKQQLEESNRKYEMLKSARMLSVADEDIVNAQKRVSKLIRTVNQCLTMLKEDK